MSSSSSDPASDNETLRQELAAAQQVIERLHARQAEHLPLSLHQAIVETLDQVILVRDADGRLVFMNDRARQLLHLRLGNVLEKDGLEGARLLRPNGSPLALNEYPGARTLRTGQPLQDFLCLHEFSDGRRQWVSISTRPVDLGEGDGTRRGVIVSFRDASSRVQALNALRESEDRFRAIFEQSNDGIRLVNEHGIIVQWNWALEDITGVQASEAVGQPVAALLFRLIPPEQVAKRGLSEAYFQQQVEEIVQQGISFLREESREIQIQRPDGQQRWIRETVFPLSTSQGMMACGIVRDITQQRQAEEEHRRRLAEETRVQVLRDFIRKAGHDLRTPLAVIVNNLYLASHAPSPDRCKSSLNAIELQVSRLQRIVDGMMNLTELEMETEFDLELLDVSAMVGDIAAQYALMADKQGRLLRMAVPDSFPRMYLDPFYFKQALGSVLENAVQYSNKGGAITLSLSQDAEWACIEVHNTGQGIAAEDLPHIFEHFYRAERVREMVKGGIGLGLPLARRVVEAHGGRIEVDNQPGEGVTFRLYFPLTDPAPPAEQTAADVP